MEYKGCILAAGKNDRLPQTNNVNHVLLPLGDKSILSIIIEKFPENIEIVIAVGYKAQQIKDYISLVHFNRRITFVDIDDWESSNSGPGYSLLRCKEHLQCPFILTTCYDIVEEEIPEPDKNWVGVSSLPHATDSKDFAIAEVSDSLVTNLYIKLSANVLMRNCHDFKTILNNALIGINGVYDYTTFWDALKFSIDNCYDASKQISNSIKKLIEKRVYKRHFTYFDTGHQVGYEYANRYFGKNRVLEKENEFIYFENDLVIKYFSDSKIAQQRKERATILKGLVPEIYAYKNNLYAYRIIKGKTLPQITNNQVFIDMLEFYKKNLWKEKKLSHKERTVFYNSCLDFYKTKTANRVTSFYGKTGIKDKEEVINGIKIPKLSVLLDKIDWDNLKHGIPVLFHGDFQPENIIITPDNRPVLIDWRHSFNNIMEYGDLYYDFAKMYHALIICGEIIRNNQFEIDITGDKIEYNFLVKGNLLDFKERFSDFIKLNGYDFKKIRVLTSLIFLNIAPLHHTPYNKLLYFLGKRMLFDELKGDLYANLKN